MSQNPAFVCRCQLGERVYRQESDCFVSYRNVRMPVPAGISVQHCARCERDYLDAPVAATVAATFKVAYERDLKVRVRAAIDAVTRVVSQRRLEKLLGLSQGYVSRLRAGAGNPSPELVTHLALIARDPTARLREIEVYWASPGGADLSVATTSLEGQSESA